MDEDDEILLTAARAAAAKLPELERDYAELSEKLQKLGIKIAQYKTIMASAGIDISSNQAIQQEIGEKRASKGSCMADIDSVLAGKEMTATEIQKAIRDQLGNDYAFSTIHSNLKRGEAAGNYMNVNGKWSESLF